MAGCCLALFSQGFPVSSCSFFLPNEMNFIPNLPGSRTNTNTDGSFTGVAISLQMREIYIFMSLAYFLS